MTHVHVVAVKNIKNVMAQCPKCRTPIAVDFGIYTCAVCDSVLFIDISGNVQLDSAPKLDPAPTPDFVMSPLPTPLESELPPAFPEVLPENPIASPSPLPMEFPSEAFATEAPEFDSGQELPSPLPEPPPQIARSNLQPASPDLSDIATFGNSESSLGKEGPYIYDVLIWNIDSKEIRESLRTALQDRRFGWDAERIMGTINQGAVRIAQINAVKAAVLINRIKNLPLGISWEQNLHTDSSV